MEDPLKTSGKHSSWLRPKCRFRPWFCFCASGCKLSWDTSWTGLGPPGEGGDRVLPPVGFFSPVTKRSSPGGARQRFPVSREPGIFPEGRASAASVRGLPSLSFSTPHLLAFLYCPAPFLRLCRLRSQSQTVFPAGEVTEENSQLSPERSGFLHVEEMRWEHTQLGTHHIPQTQGETLCFF